MQKKRNRLAVWIIGLATAALLLADVLPAFAAAQPWPAPAPVAAAPDRVHVAERKTLMDLLFGRDKDEERPPVEKPIVRQQQQRQQQQPRRQQQAAPSLPAVPAKPKVNKAEDATRLAVFGDSMAVDVAGALERFYEEDPNIIIVNQGVGSSGIVRDDYFDWPKTIDEQVTNGDVDIAVMIIGINDRQNIGGDKPLTDGWPAAYKARVTGIVQELRTANIPIIWVGLPPMSQPTYGKAMTQISELQRLAVFGAGGEFLDIYERFADENGKYTATGPDLNGALVRMRKDDGIHLSTAGADKLAFYLSQSLKTYYRGGGTVGIEIADPLLGTDAQLMLRPPYQGLGQMKLLEVAGAVISLTHAARRATDLIRPETVAASEPDAPEAGFDMLMMLEAPIGRADAFGVGIPPGSGEDEAIDAAALTPPPATVVPVADTATP